MEFKVTEEHFARARELREKGYRQVSRKYRLFARLPEGLNGYEALKAVSPTTAQGFLDGFLEGCAEYYCRVFAHQNGEEVEVSIEVFNAWLKLKACRELLPEEHAHGKKKERTDDDTDRSPTRARQPGARRAHMEDSTGECPSLASHRSGEKNGRCSGGS